MNKGFSIAIDGPVAAGKGTIAPALAKKLNGFYLYTGAMYRCLALYCIENNIDVKNEDMVVSALSKIDVQFKGDEVLLNEVNVTEKIKDEKIGFASSTASLYKKVRERMVEKQQEVAGRFLEEGKIVVAEGRDTATKVLPNANLKIFLTASSSVRAKRRLDQIKERGQDEIFDKVLEEVERRDKQDTERQIDPLAKDPKKLGYYVLDNSDLSEEETINKILQLIKND